MNTRTIVLLAAAAIIVAIVARPVSHVMNHEFTFSTFYRSNTIVKNQGPEML